MKNVRMGAMMVHDGCDDGCMMGAMMVHDGCDDGCMMGAMMVHDGCDDGCDYGCDDCIFIDIKSIKRYKYTPHTNV
jgi:hypothetical protein